MSRKNITTVTKSGAKQMQKKWIEYNLREMGLSKKIRNDILKNKYDPILTKINKDGSLKYIKLLDKRAKQIKEFK